MQDKAYNWAVIGCGAIANEFAHTMKNHGRNIYAVSSRTHSNALKFAEKYDISRVHEDIDDIFSDENVDIVYIATPHNTHIKYIEKALKAKKHVLCEKAITLNSKELEKAVSLKDEAVLAEAMTIYHMPLYKELKSRADRGDFGKLNIIQMNFGSFKEYNPENRFFNKYFAGGALLDIGVYALSFIRFFMKSKPEQVSSQVKMSDTGVDEASVIILKNKENELASASLSLRSKQPKRATLSFEKVYIEIFDYPRASEAHITYTDDGHTETVSCGNTNDALFYEIVDTENAVSGMNNDMFLQYTRDVMDIMTDLRENWGLKYPEET